MGGLFDSGPSDGDIQRAEEKARLAEADRLRLMEIDLRRNESAEIIQGEGLAEAQDVVLGDDLEDGDTSQQPLGDTPLGAGISGNKQPLDEGFNFNDVNLRAGATGFGSGTLSGRGFGNTGRSRQPR